jgi:hypothetical protein
MALAIRFRRTSTQTIKENCRFDFHQKRIEYSCHGTALTFRLCRPNKTRTWISL